MKETLENCINRKLSELDLPAEYQKIENFINSDQTSIDFIKWISHDYAFPEVGKITGIAEARARHSALTFLIGLVLSPFGNVYASTYKVINNSKNTSKNQCNQLWLLTALNHDVGYFSDLLKQPKVNYKDKFKYFLLKDDYKEPKLAALSGYSQKHKSALAYSYDEIALYDQYARNYHAQKNDEEKVDHGVLGGLITFDRMIKETLKQNDAMETLLQAKAVGLTIAQHNFYKSSSAKDDEQYPALLRYKLSHDSSYKISSETPLLLYLCLIDTIECVKKLSKGENKNNTEKSRSSYMQTLTVIKNIDIEVLNGYIEIDYCRLHELIVKKYSKELHEKFEQYKRSVEKISDWTDFGTVKVNEDTIKITLKN